MCKNTWGIYPWFVEAGDTCIDPMDRERFKSLSPYGKVFECIAEDQRYIVLKYGKEVYRVKGTLYKQVNAPLFAIGEMVQVNGKPEVVGVIADVNWHHKENTVVYYISVDGKRKSSRYMKQDLIKI